MGGPVRPWESLWASRDADAIAEQVAAGGGAAKALATEYGLRMRALRWVGELDGEGRAARIASCGFMELMFQPATGGVGWRNRWCRDRACPGCARRRANKLRHELREHLELRRTDATCGRFMFVTLTQRKRGIRQESPGAAVTRLLLAWRKLTNRRPFKVAVQGYIRATEVTFSPRGGWPGWHAHLHLVLELGPELRRSDVERYIRHAWCELVDGDDQAQNFQTLTETRLGQVVKYITKPFELPDDLAPTFFGEMKGRRLISGAGTWRDFTKHDDDDYQAAPGWIPQASHVSELIDAAEDPRRLWTFQWLATEKGPRPVCPWREPGPDEVVCQRQLPTGDAWVRLAEDLRSVTLRCKSPARSALDPGETPAAERQRSGGGVSPAVPVGARAGPDGGSL